MKRIITEDILRRYLLCVSDDADEVSRIMGLSASLEDKITEGYWLTNTNDEQDDAEYHAALAYCAAAEIIELQSTHLRDKLLRGAGFDTPEKIAAWEAAR